MMRPSTGRKQTIPSSAVVLGVLASLVNLEAPDDADVIGLIPIPCGHHVLEQGCDPQRTPKAWPSVWQCLC